MKNRFVWKKEYVVSTFPGKPQSYIYVYMYVHIYYICIYVLYIFYVYIILSPHPFQEAIRWTRSHIKGMIQLKKYSLWRNYEDSFGKTFMIFLTQKWHTSHQCDITECGIQKMWSNTELYIISTIRRHVQ